MEALGRLLRPLVRLLLRNQVPYPTAAKVLRALYVEVARDELAIPGKAQTDSRISLLTGVHRKELKRLREETTPATAPSPTVPLGAQLVARWTGARRYRGDDGRPLALPRLASEASGPSFEELVASVSTDIRPRAVLDEWLRLGIVEVDADDRIRLRHDAFIPARGFDEKASYLGENLHDHIAAAGENLVSATPPFVERSVHYGQLSSEDVATLARIAERGGMKAIQAVNRRAIELKQDAAGVPAAPRRMRFGIYFYEEEDDA